MDNISDKVVAITGGSSGIGAAAARYLAECGAKVVLGALASTAGAMEKIAAEVTEKGGQCRWFAVDVTKKNQVQEFINYTVAEFGRLDVLINNAGIMPLAPIERLKVDEWDMMIDVNMRGVLYGIAAALPVMQKQDSGHIINLGSVAGHVVTPNSAVYCATKFAVRVISEGLRQEIGEKIRVTVISPGAVQSNLASSISDPAAKEAEAQVRAIAISADVIGKAMAFAIGQPAEVDVNEILIRPTAQPF